MAVMVVGQYMVAIKSVIASRGLTEMLAPIINNLLNKNLRYTNAKALGELKKLADSIAQLLNAMLANAKCIKNINIS